MLGVVEDHRPERAALANPITLARGYDQAAQFTSACATALADAQPHTTARGTAPTYRPAGEADRPSFDEPWALVASGRRRMAPT